MKRILTIVISIIMVILLVLTCVRSIYGFNFQLFDTTWHFDEVQIAMPNGEVISGKVDTWKDYEDSDMVQVVVDDVSYYTHGSNVVLIKYGER